MKRIIVAGLVLISAFSVMAQDNKPTAGCFGVGYVVGFFPVQQNIGFTYMVTNNLEAGGALGFQFNRNRNSAFVPIQVEGTNFISLSGNQETKDVTTTASVFITPLVKYHFSVKSNLDIFVGGNLPIGVAPGTKTVNSTIVTADNYNSTETTTTTAPVSVTVGLGALLGCQYFFYKNLALGATANLGFSAIIANGNNTTTLSGSNTGSNNPDAGIPIPSTTTKQMVKNDNEGAGMLHEFDLSLSWYFGNAGK